MKNLINNMRGKRVSTQAEDEPKPTPATGPAPGAEDMPGEKPEETPEDEAAKKKATEDMPEDPEKNPEDMPGAKGRGESDVSISVSVARASVDDLQAAFPGDENAAFVLEQFQKKATMLSAIHAYTARLTAALAKAQADVTAARKSALDATGGVPAENLPATTPGGPGGAMGLTGDPNVDAQNEHARKAFALKQGVNADKVTPGAFAKWAAMTDREGGAGAYVKYLTEQTTSKKKGAA